ncbi:hypothetical protein ACFFRR_009524 [Megaselia abdita]
MVLNLSAVPPINWSLRTINEIPSVAVNDTSIARQRASVKWLMSKAFNNRVPDQLREPFYQDNEGQEHLKPQIVVGLGNATLYCQTLSNLYSDPNYQSLNHWSILQTLARKGVPVAESPEMPLTETVLIQTNPLRNNAHMSVIESLMILYAKEISSGDRIPNAIRRISGGNTTNNPSLNNQNFEQSLLTWISHACASLKRRIDQEIENGATDEQGVRLQSPNIPPVQDFQGLCDGVCLALLISYYCPKVIPWSHVRINYLPSVEDSIHNVLLVSSFSQKHLPYSVFHMTPEDVTYMRGSMKQNLVVLLADLFNLFEIHPAKCVCYPGMDCQVTRSASANVIMRKSTPPKEYQYVEQNNYSTPQHQQDEGFVVHRSRGVTTLSSIHNQVQEPLVPARLRQAKEKTNIESKADERGDGHAAGKPSNWEHSRRSSFAGRRSRRNSFSDDSQLTIENFGGSQDQLNTIGRNYERERERKTSTTSISAEPAIPLRSSIADARGTLQLGYDTDSGSEKQDRETEKNLRRQGSVDNVSQRNKEGDETPKRKTSFATLPSNTTTWQQQSVLSNQSGSDEMYSEEDTRPLVDATKLSSIRMKLEEKRRRIEQEKRKIEVELSKHQEKVGKAAFLQAINKGKAQTISTTSSEGGDKEHLPSSKETSSNNSVDGDNITKSSNKPSTNNQDDIEYGLDSKWETSSNESKRTPDIDPSDLDKYHHSIAMMNTNLHDIQQDIQRLATQQSQIHAQHLQAQQLMQAQQISNMLNQQQQLPPPPQPYGSQQMPGYQRSNFGSTTHIPNNSYNSRPPSRDPYSQQQQQQQQQQHMQYVNDHGQYINHPPPPIYSREGSFLNENGYNSNYNTYNSNHNHYQPQPPHYPMDHPNQYQSHQSYINRPPDYDDYPLSHRGRDPNSPQPNQFYLHESSPQPPPQHHQPQPPQRRTWAQSAAAQSYNDHSLVDVNAWQQGNKIQESRGTWRSSQNNLHQNNGGFMLHQNGGSGNDYPVHEKSYQNLFPVHSSPQHRQTPPRQQQQPQHQQQQRQAVPFEDMAPQSISFIGDDDDQVDQIEMNIELIPPSPQFHHSNHPTSRNSLPRPQKMIIPSGNDDFEPEVSLSKLNISSGSLTYRIPSPSRPALNANSFTDPQHEDPTVEKGFYISFDDNQPRKPKPPLRAKRSPKKEKSLDGIDRKDDIKLQRSFSQHEKRNSIQVEAPNRAATYNKYTDSVIHPIHMSNNNSSSDRRHFEDLTNQQHSDPNADVFTVHHTQSSSRLSSGGEPKENMALVIDTDAPTNDTAEEMEKKKEKIMLMSLQRRQRQEEDKARKELEVMQRREREREKEEEKTRKKEEQVAKRAAILEQHRLKKAIEEAEREGKPLDQRDYAKLHAHASPQQSAPPRLRAQKVTRPRPKTIHVESGSVDISEASSLSSRGKKGSSTNLTESPDEYPSTSSTPIGRRGSYKNSREPTLERGRTLSRIAVPTSRGTINNFRGRKSNSLMNLCDTDSGLGRSTPPRRAPSPGMGGRPTGVAGINRHLPSPSGPESLPPGLVSKRRGFDDGASDISSTPNSMMEYSGPKLYKQPAAKSNRGIILNAVEYCVFPGAVNRDAKQKVLEKIARSEAKHFLVLFRDAGCQFRALYSYWPENEQIVKLYGIGPSQVDEVMFDKFFKYNSGGKCFSQVHTKHLTVTIDAFTIHNSLWQGKKTNLPSKKDMALVV